MLQPRQPVPLIGAKRAGFRYNRRDIQFDERFEAVSPNDAAVLVRAKLARHPDDVVTAADDERPPAPPELAGRARDATAARGDDRSSTAENGAVIPTPEVTLPDPASVASSTHNAPELNAAPSKPAKKRVRSKAKAKAPDSAPQP